MKEIAEKAIAVSAKNDNRDQYTNAGYSNNKRRFTYSGRRRPCPICGRTKDQDCRWNDQVVFCHTHIDQDVKDPRYLYRGATKDSLWGQYFPTDQLQKPIPPKGKKAFFYPSRTGEPLARVTRNDDGEGGKRFPQDHWNGKRWDKCLPDDIKQQVPLYRINDPLNKKAVEKGSRILIVEGEGKVNLLLGLGIPATSCIGGSTKWRSYGYPTYLDDLKGAQVILCPDMDKPGVEHCLDIAQDFPNAQWLYPYPDSPVWDNLPEKHGLDIANWIADFNLTAEQILAAIGPKQELNLDAQLGDRTDRGGNKKKAVVELLLGIAEEIDCFHTPDQEAYADIQVNEIRQTYPIRNPIFKRWLRHQLYMHYRRTAGSEQLSQALGVLEAKANFDSCQREVIFAWLNIKARSTWIWVDQIGPSLRLMLTDGKWFPIIQLDFVVQTRCCLCQCLRWAVLCLSFNVC